MSYSSYLFPFLHVAFLILFSEAVMGHHSDATVSVVHRCIADYLKLAPHRTGSAGKGCRNNSRFATALNETDSGNTDKPTADPDDSDGTDTYSPAANGKIDDADYN